MVRYHIEVEFEDGSVYVFSMEKIEGLFDDLKLIVGGHHGYINSINVARDYYDSPVGINNQ